MSNGISQRTREFLLAHVDSIESLEVLLLLADRPMVAFTAEQVSDQLRTAAASAANRLSHLHTHRLVDIVDGSAYRLRDDAELAETLKQVAEAYRQWRVTVVTLIYSRPSEVVRVFSDAFVFKKGKRDG